MAELIRSGSNIPQKPLPKEVFTFSKRIDWNSDYKKIYSVIKEFPNYMLVSFIEPLFLEDNNDGNTMIYRVKSDLINLDVVGNYELTKDYTIKIFKAYEEFKNKLTIKNRITPLGQELFKSIGNKIELLAIDEITNIGDSDCKAKKFQDLSAEYSICIFLLNHSNPHYNRFSEIYKREYLIRDTMGFGIFAFLVNKDILDYDIEKVLNLSSLLCN